MQKQAVYFICVVFIFTSIRLFSQSTIVNYDFNSGSSYATLSPSTAAGVTSTASSSESWQTYGGTASGGSAFTSNSTAGNALAMSNSSGTNTRYFQFQLGGANLSTYCCYKIYLQAQRSSTGAQTITLEYSTNGSSWTTFGTTGSSGNGSFAEITFDLCSVAAIDNQSAVYFRLYASGASGSGTLRIDNFEIQASNSCSSNTITTGSIAPTSISLSGCTGTGTASVAFTSTGTFDPSNTYYAYMSDGSGNFNALSPVVGTLNSSANSGTITITIPAGTAAGTNYQIQVTSYSPAVIGSSSTNHFTVTTTCAAGTPVSGMMSNCAALQAAHATGYGCDASCDETPYTIGPFAGNSASDVLCVGGASVTCSSCSSYTQSVTFTITAGCTYTAEAKYGARGVNCPDAAMDGNDEIHISGNGGTVVSQYAQVVTTSSCSATGAAGTHTYTTADVNDGCANAEGYAKLVYSAPAGNIATITISYVSNRCDEILTYTFTGNNATCGVMVLPVNLLAFTANRIDDGNILVKWATASESNNDYFMLEYSTDGKNFSNYKEVKGMGNSSFVTDYEYVFNENIGNKTPYFRLKQVDYNGKYQYSTVITLGNYIGSLYSNPSKTTAYYNTENDNIITNFQLSHPQQVNISLYDMAGRQVHTMTDWYNYGDNQVIIPVSAIVPGTYILLYQAGGNTPVRKKIMITR